MFNDRQSRFNLGSCTMHAAIWVASISFFAATAFRSDTRLSRPTNIQPTPIRFLQEWGKQGTEPGEFRFPIGIATNRADEVFVTDHYNNRVQKFDSAGKLLANIEVLPNPGGIAIDESGSIFVSHFPASRLSEQTTPDRVSVHDKDGNLVGEWGSSGTEDGQFSWPGGIAISRNGRVYVADQTNRRVQV